MNIIMVICSVVTCLGTIFGTYATLKVSQAVMNTRLDELTREVRLHNNFASRVPLIEQELESCNKLVITCKSYSRSVIIC